MKLITYLLDIYNSILFRC